MHRLVLSGSILGIFVILKGKFNKDYVSTFGTCVQSLLFEIKLTVIYLQTLNFRFFFEMDHIKIVFPLIIALFSCSNPSPLKAQRYQVTCIGFYNLENLFDTVDDSLTFDEEFTPTGLKVWTEEKYQDKINRLGTVIRDLGKDVTPDGVGILGVSEIENIKVLEDLVRSKNLAERNYKIVHYDSPDARGVDVGLLYREKFFTVLSSQSVRVDLIDEYGKSKKTRDILLVKGLIGDKKYYVSVNHWPSRRGGEKLTEKQRNQAARINRQLADSILNIEPDATYLMMGDLNDNPSDYSMTKIIQAKKDLKELTSYDFYNPFYKNYSTGEGTLAHDDAWGLFDQIVFTPNALQKNPGSFYYYKNQIYRKDFMMETSGHYRNFPKRTFSGDIYNYGYSDHFPVLIYLIRPD